MSDDLFLMSHVLHLMSDVWCLMSYVFNGWCLMPYVLTYPCSKEYHPFKSVFLWCLSSSTISIDFHPLNFSEERKELCLVNSMGTLYKSLPKIVARFLNIQAEFNCILPDHSPMNLSTSSSIETKIIERFSVALQDFSYITSFCFFLLLFHNLNFLIS